MSRTRFTKAAPFLCVLVILAAACSSSGNDPSPEPTATPQPSPSPVPTATTPPQVTPEASATPASPGIEITLPVCVTRGNAGGGLPGTAPGPTPTPLPEGGRTDSELISREIREYLGIVGPVASHVEDWTVWFETAWADPGSPEEQANALQLFGARLAQACSALFAQSYIPPEALDHQDQLQSAVSGLYSWLGTAALELECCGDSKTNPVLAAFDTARQMLTDRSVAADQLASEYEVEPAEAIEFSDAVLGIEFTLGDQWMIAANGLSPVFAAPFSQSRLDISGLGPDSWQNGTAVRVRRLRNPSPIDVETASSRFAGLITQQGSIASAELTVVDGHDGLLHRLDPSLADWKAAVTVVVVGNFTYFIETGCPGDVPGACAAAETVASSVKFIS